MDTFFPVCKNKKETMTGQFVMTTKKQNASLIAWKSFPVYKRSDFKVTIQKTAVKSTLLFFVFLSLNTSVFNVQNIS